MSRRKIEITFDGADKDVMPVVLEEMADQMLRGMRSGRLDLMDGIDWSMRDVPQPVDIDMRQRRAAALLLMAVGDVPMLTAMAGSVHQATSVCPGLTAADLPPPTAEGRLQALREARDLIDAMLGERP